MKRFLKWSAIVVGSLSLFLIIVVGSFLGWLKWTGERDWKRAEAELRAKGEKLTFAELVPPMPPESENFYADPLWMEYADLVLKKNAYGVDEWKPRLAPDQFQLQRWQDVPLTREEKNRLSKLMPDGKKIETRKEAISLLRNKLLPEKNPQKQKEAASLFLDVIAPAEPVLTRIAKLSERPRAQFSIRYDLGLSAPLSQITAILSLSQIINKKLLSEIILGKNSEAAADALTLLRLTSILKNEPLLISFLVRASIVELTLETINEGILRHAWTEADLDSFQKRLNDLSLQDDALLALKVERAIYNQIDPLSVWTQLGNVSATSGLIDKIEGNWIRLYFGSILLKDKTYHNLWLQRNLEKLHSDITKGWNTASNRSSEEEINALAENPLKKQIYLLNVISAPAFLSSYQKAAECQTFVDQGMIACALERYHISHGSYPESLDLLLPEYLTKLPNSPITGKQMNYSLNSDGTFLLWSPGWNLKSLGGKPGEFKGDGDIVWIKPLPMKDRPKTASSPRS